VEVFDPASRRVYFSKTIQYKLSRKFIQWEPSCCMQIGVRKVIGTLCGFCERGKKCDIRTCVFYFGLWTTKPHLRSANNFHSYSKASKGRTIAQAGSQRLPTPVARVRF
jgi:hypothetical protein